MSINIENVSVRFSSGTSQVATLRNISLSIGTQKIFGLVGESGSGKSTLALTLMGLLASNASVTSGTLTIGGRSYDLTRKNATADTRGRSIAMIFQDPFTTLNPVFTVAAHLSEALARREPGLPRSTVVKRLVGALSDVGFASPEAYLGSFPHQLSGGMRQRVVIAMAMLARPELLIADEPTTALDATVEAQVMRQIVSLRDRIGCSVLLITHSLGLVAEYCDDMAVLYAGEVMEAGPVGRISRSAAHPYSRALLACEIAIDTPRVPGVKFQVIPGELPDPAQLPQGCIYAPRCDRAAAVCAASPPIQTVAPGHVASCHFAGKS